MAVNYLSQFHNENLERILNENRKSIISFLDDDNLFSLIKKNSLELENAYSKSGILTGSEILKVFDTEVKPEVDKFLGIEGMIKSPNIKFLNKKEYYEGLSMEIFVDNYDPLDESISILTKNEGLIRSALIHEYAHHVCNKVIGGMKDEKGMIPDYLIFFEGFANGVTYGLRPPCFEIKKDNLVIMSLIYLGGKNSSNVGNSEFIWNHAKGWALFSYFESKYGVDLYKDIIHKKFNIGDVLKK